jgi:two-component system LytT family response regulator
MADIKKIKCLVVDDEPLAIRVIQNHLDKIPFAEAVATANSAMEAINMLRDFPIDLVFLDIDMPEINGLDLIRGLPDPPAFIFVTAFREFAADAFDLDALDYLLKPVSFHRFLRAINKFKDQETEYIKEKATIQVRVDRCVQNVEIEQVLYIEGLKDYVKVHLRDGTFIITRETMSGMEKLLSDRGFIRCHKSFLVALSKVVKFSSESLNIEGVSIPIGRKYKVGILSILKGA